MQTRSMKLKERAISGTVLNKLPAEILGMITTQTDNKGLASMRETCRELRDGSASEFFRRYTSLTIRLEGSERFGHVEVLALRVETKTPDVFMAQAMTQSLIVPEAWNSIVVSPRNKIPLRNRVPDQVATVKTSTPGMSDFEVTQRTIVKDYLGSGVEPLLLKRIAALVPRTLKLHTLFLEDLTVDGNDLINLLETHQRNLQDVRLHNIVLTKAAECMTALSRAEPQKLWLENLGVRDDAGNLQYLTVQSPAFLDLRQYLLQRDPDAKCYIFNHSSDRPIHVFYFKCSDGI